MFLPTRLAASFMVAASALAALPAQAQNSIFPAGWDSNVRSRLFMRLGYTTALTKTKSDAAKDVTGPVLTRQQIAAAFDRAIQISQVCGGASIPGVVCESRYSDGDGTTWELAKAVIETAFDDSGETAIGTPPGIKAKAQRQIGTPTVSVGYWLDEDKRWLLEGFVLAAPMSVEIKGDGYRADGTPNGVNGKHIATTKLLPPLVIGSYHIGAKENTVRPYVGVGAMYAIFFGGKSTPFFDNYQGGKSSISTKNTFGVGPFVGLQTAVDDDWHLNVSVGQIGLRSRSTIVTNNTLIGTGAPVLQDINPRLLEAINGGEELVAPTLSSGVGVTTIISELAARNRGQQNLGTYVREQKMKITNTIITFSVGRNF